MNLDEVRVKINDINDQMLALFKERMELSKDVAAAKKEMNKAIYDAKRERDILDKVTRDAGPDLDLYARRFFEALFISFFAAATSLESSMRSLKRASIWSVISLILTRTSSKFMVNIS